MATDPRLGISLGGLQLRALQAGDLVALASLHAQLDSSPWTVDNWRTCLGDAYQAWVIEFDGRPIAYCAFLVLPDEAELLALGVAQTHQQQGIGQAVLESAISLLPQTSSRCLLEVRRSNLPAINLYRKLGFCEIATRRDYYQVAGGSREDAVIMQRPLGPECLASNTDWPA